MEHYRIGGDGRIYYLTMSVVEWLPIFVIEPTCRVITDSLNHVHHSGQLRTHAYVIMPTHWHAIVSFPDADTAAMTAVLRNLRKFTGRKLVGLARSHLPPSFFNALECKRSDRDHQFWQRSSHPVLVESEGFFEVKRRYIHENPCRKGLVIRPEHWRFSSASYYVEDVPGTNDVNLTPLVW